MPKYLKWILLAGILGMVALGGFVVVTWLSITIARYPSCLTYESKGNPILADKLQENFLDYFRKQGFEMQASDKGAKWESSSTRVTWDRDSQFWMNICTKDESLLDWRVIAQDIQEIGQRAQWFPEASLSLNPDVSGCRAGNGVRLGHAVDFKKLDASIARVKATCSGRR